MEVNITIFIQAFIFLMLFIVLSNVLFRPLKDILQEREKYTLDEEFKINLIYKNIKKKDIYIDEKISGILKKSQILYNINNKDNLIKEQRALNFYSMEHQKKNNEILCYLKNKKKYVEKKIKKDTLYMIIEIYKRLYKH